MYLCDQGDAGAGRGGDAMPHGDGRFRDCFPQCDPPLPGVQPGGVQGHLFSGAALFRGPLFRAAADPSGVSAGGGVAANSLLRSELKALEKSGYTVTFPSLKLCTDNGAMVAGLGYRYLMDGITSDARLSASARVSAFKKN